MGTLQIKCSLYRRKFCFAPLDLICRIFPSRSTAKSDLTKYDTVCTSKNPSCLCLCYKNECITVGFLEFVLMFYERALFAIPPLSYSPSFYVQFSASDERHWQILYRVHTQYIPLHIFFARVPPLKKRPSYFSIMFQTVAEWVHFQADPTMIYVRMYACTYAAIYHMHNSEN